MSNLKTPVKLVAIFFVILVALLASLFVFGAISRDDFADAATKLAGVSLIAVAATSLVSWLSG